MMDTGQRVKLVKSRAWQIRRRQEKHITERLSLVSVALFMRWDISPTGRRVRCRA